MTFIPSWNAQAQITFELFPITYFSYTLTHEIIFYTRGCAYYVVLNILFSSMALKVVFIKYLDMPLILKILYFCHICQYGCHWYGRFPALQVTLAGDYSLFCDRMLGSSTFLGSRKNVKVQLHINTWTTAVSLKLQNERLYFEEKMRYSSVYERWG